MKEIITQIMELLDENGLEPMGMYGNKLEEYLASYLRDHYRKTCDECQETFHRKDYPDAVRCYGCEYKDARL